MSAHTPGPWKAEPNFRSSGWFVDQPTGARRIALVNERDASIERPECEANARLIAAAPELLEALKDVHRFLNEEPTARTLQQKMTIDAVVRAAIAKATGESC